MVRSKFIGISALLGAILLLGPYQNCALHQSEGRKQFEKLLSHSAGPNDNGCLPFLSRNTAGAIMEDVATTTELRFIDSEKNCVVSSDQPFLADRFVGVETATCLLSQEASFQGVMPGSSALLSQFPNIKDNEYHNYIAESDATSSFVIASGGTIPSSFNQGFYGFAALASDSSMSYHFLNTDLGLECRFSVDSTSDYSTSPVKDEFIRRGFKLSNEIHLNFE